TGKHVPKNCGRIAIGRSGCFRKFRELLLIASLTVTIINRAVHAATPLKTPGAPTFLSVFSQKSFLQRRKWTGIFALQFCREKLILKDERNWLVRVLRTLFRPRRQSGPCRSA